MGCNVVSKNCHSEFLINQFYTHRSSLLFSVADEALDTPELQCFKLDVDRGYCCCLLCRVAQCQYVCITIQGNRMFLLDSSDAPCTCAVVGLPCRTLQWTHRATFTSPSTRADTFLAKRIRSPIDALNLTLVTTEPTPVSDAFAFPTIRVGSAVDADKAANMTETALPGRLFGANTLVAGF